jgi:hypothetical protein
MINADKLKEKLEIFFFDCNSKIPQPVLEIMFDSLGRLRS